MRLPNGYGSVRKLSGKRRNPWMVQKTIGYELDHETGRSRQIRRTIGYFPTKKAGLDALTQYNAKPWNLDGRSVTLETIYGIWSDKKYPEISDSGVKMYEAAWRYLRDLWKVPIADIKTEPIQDIIDHMDKSKSMLNAVKGIMKSCFDYAMRNDMVDRNYAEFVRIRSVDVKIERKLYTPEQIAKLWEISRSSDSMAADVILILLYTGMRIRELLDLPADCCHLEDRYLDIQQAKTDAGIRCVPIHDDILPLVAKYRRKGGPYLICEGSRDHITYSLLTAHRTPDVYRSIGQEHTMHDTRHTFVSQWREQGLDELYLKMVIGHARHNVTDAVYTHVKPETLLRETNRICYLRN